MGVERFDRVAQVLTDDVGARAEDGVAFVQRLCSDLGVPGVSAFGVRDVDVEEVVGLAEKASSMKANPLVLTRAELAGVLLAAC